MLSEAVKLTPKELLRPEVVTLRPYRVAEAQGMIKLDAMENPYRWPSRTLLAAWQRSLADLELNRYPDASAAHLCSRLREEFRIPAQAGLLLGNGSDELIQMLALAVAAPGRVLLTPEPGFAMYRMICVCTGLRYQPVPLTVDFSLDTGSMLSAIERLRPALVFLAYPNNPTGNCFELRAVEAVIEAASGLVVVDEAYSAFSDHSFMARLGEFPNLLVMRTLSKLGLAGLRLGYLAGNPAWIEQLDKLRLPYNINALTQASAVFALDHREQLDRQSALIREERARVASQLAGLEGLRVYPSEANFLLIRMPRGRGQEIFAGLLGRGILVKNLAGGPRLDDCLRVTIGSKPENDQFIDALSALL